MQRYIDKDVLYSAVMPHSEVCIHIGVAGKRVYFQWDGSRSVQLYKVVTSAAPYFVTGLEPYSAPILPGEAGIFTDADGRLYFNQEV